MIHWIPPFHTTILPFHTMILPFHTMFLPFHTMILPFHTMILPFHTMILPFHTMIPPVFTIVPHSCSPPLHHDPAHHTCWCKADDYFPHVGGLAEQIASRVSINLTANPHGIKSFSCAHCGHQNSIQLANPPNIPTTMHATPPVHDLPSHDTCTQQHVAPPPHVAQPPPNTPTSSSTAPHPVHPTGTPLSQSRAMPPHSQSAAIPAPMDTPLPTPTGLHCGHTTPLPTHTSPTPPQSHTAPPRAGMHSVDMHLTHDANKRKLPVCHLASGARVLARRAQLQQKFPNQEAVVHNIEDLCDLPSMHTLWKVQKKLCAFDGSDDAHHSCAMCHEHIMILPQLDPLSHCHWTMIVPLILRIFHDCTPLNPLLFTS